MKREIKLIINPNSGGGRGKKVANYIGEKYSDLFSEIVFTNGPEEAIELAEESENFDTICFVGGDGTLNEVVNGVMKIPEEKRPKIGIIPVGTGNDFIKTIGIPKDIDKAIDIILNGKTKKLDVVLCTFKNFEGKEVKRHYINITEFGMGGEVANLVNKYGKIFRGTIPFLIFAIICNFTYKNKKVRIKTDSEQEEFRDFSAKIRVVAVANGRFYGGGMQIAPFADVEDGLLDIVVVKDMNSIETLKSIPLLYQGEKGFEKAKKTKKVLYFRARTVEVEADEKDKIMIEMEGEVPGHTPKKFEIIPKGIDFIVP